MNTHHGQKLKAIFAALGISVQEFEAKTGISDTTVYRWLKKDKLDQIDILTLKGAGINIALPVEAFKGKKLGDTILSANAEELPAPTTDSPEVAELKRQLYAAWDTNRELIALLKSKK